jgi:hypothetical protein
MTEEEQFSSSEEFLEKYPEYSNNTPKSFEDWYCAKEGTSIAFVGKICAMRMAYNAGAASRDDEISRLEENNQDLYEMIDKLKKEIADLRWELELERMKDED